MKRVQILIAFVLATVLPSVALGQVYYPSGITRAEFVRLAMEQTGTFSLDGTHCFSDVTTQSYATYVCAAKQQGIITGNPNGTFRPDAPITFLEAGVIALRAERISVGSAAVWYQPYLTKLAEFKAIPSSISNVTAPISYQQGVDLIQAVMNRDGDSDSDNDNDNDDDQDSDDDMTMSITVSDATPNPGDRITFRIRLENESNDDIDDIQVLAELDGDMEYISSTDDGNLDDEEVEWDDIEVEEDESRTILLNVEIDEDADDGDTLRLQVSAENGDELNASKSVRVEDDDDDDDDDDLRLTITDSDDPVEEGENITYHIRLENEGNDDIDVDVTAFIDEDTDFVSASHSGDESRDEVDWDDIEVEEDEAVTLTLTVRLKSSADDGDTLELRVEANKEEDTERTKVEDDDDDDDNDDDDENVNITITEDDDPVEEGDSIVYRITIENQENHDIEIDVIATLDDEVSYLSSSHDGDLEGDDEVIWEDFEIDEDQTRVLTLTVRAQTSLNDGDEVELTVEAGDDEDEETTEIED